MQQAALFRRERQVGVVVWLMLICCLSAIICERHLGFFCADCLSPLACYSPADSADHAERNAAGCIISQRKTDCLRLMMFCGFGFCLRDLRDQRETFGFLLCRLIESSCVLFSPYSISVNLMILLY